MTSLHWMSTGKNSWTSKRLTVNTLLLKYHRANAYFIEVKNITADMLSHYSGTHEAVNLLLNPNNNR